jgi:hypothetical protein
MAHHTKPFLVNDHPGHRYSRLNEIPETQLLMLVPVATWARLPEYINSFEAFTLAGRFGADPGDFEWEWVDDPPGLRWWRRTGEGIETMFGMAVGIHVQPRTTGLFGGGAPQPAQVELYAMVSVSEDSPFWSEAVAEAVVDELQFTARSLANERHLDFDQTLNMLCREHYQMRGMITDPGPPAVRKGTVREVERFQAALRGMFARAAAATLPSETGEHGRSP